MAPRTPSLLRHLMRQAGASCQMPRPRAEMIPPPVCLPCHIQIHLKHGKHQYLRGWVYPLFLTPGGLSRNEGQLQSASLSLWLYENIVYVMMVTGWMSFINHESHLYRRKSRYNHLGELISIKMDLCLCKKFRIRCSFCLFETVNEKLSSSFVYVTHVF